MREKIMNAEQTRFHSAFLVLVLYMKVKKLQKKKPLLLAVF